jgi:hypothetical protein
LISSIQPPKKIIAGVLRGKMETIFWMENLQLLHDLSITEFHSAGGKLNFTKRKNIQDSRSGKPFQEAVKDFKKQF